MPGRAMGFFGIPGSRSYASQAVYPLLYRLKVSWVYAIAYPAKVVDVQALWDWAFGVSIGNTMSVLSFAVKV